MIRFKLFMLILIINIIHLYPQSKYVLKCREDILEISELIAIGEVGTIEYGRSNTGEIEKYLNCTGLRKGQPYCAAGQYYCFAEAVRILHLPVSYIPIKRTGNANQMFVNAIQNGKQNIYLIKKNDLVIWRKGKSKMGHIERVIVPGKAGWATTLGFNVRLYNINKKKYAEGVFIMRRNIYHPLSRMRVRGILGFKVISWSK
ncbi:MAG: hypothetical protein HZB41_07135 [Ignavibacteriae bacterium]|nr:hypothetical protein [Ignavibacteriota bacterium]